LYPQKVDIFPSEVRFSSVSVGFDSVCGILANSSVYCWGFVGDYGGSNNFFVSSGSTPEKIPLGITNITSIDNGGRSSSTDYYCVIVENGSVACWGDTGPFYSKHNLYPYGGTYTESNSVYFTPPPAGERYVIVNAGRYTTCAITNESTVDCWGIGDENGGFGDSLGYHSGCCTGTFLLYDNQRIVGPSRDYDGDSITNMDDYCEDGYMNWSPSISNDFDGDGCHDTQEDNDDDNDRFSDSLEQSCLSSPLNA
jgi:hypothetical protein